MAAVEFDADYFIYDSQETRNLVKLEKAIQYLANQVGSQSHKLLTDETAQAAYGYVSKKLYYEYATVPYELFNQYKFHVVMGELAKHLFEIRNDISFQSQTIKLSTDMAVADIEDGNQGLIVIFKLCISITNELLSNSPAFAKNFYSTSGVKAYLDFLNDDFFTSKNSDVNLKIWDNETVNFIDYLVLNIGTLSRNSENYKEEWISLDAAPILRKAANLNMVAKFNCSMALVNVANDTQIDQLDEIQEYAVVQVDRLKLFHEKLVKGKVKRKKVQFLRTTRSTR
jgi:hypothetical protein